MSLVPYIVNELLSELDRPSYDNHFFQPYERLTVAPLRAGYLRPWRHHHQNNSGVSSVANDKDGFKISLDVQQFKPEELNVKVSFFYFFRNVVYNREDLHRLARGTVQKMYWIFLYFPQSKLKYFYQHMNTKLSNK